jgi:hypothetical protein
MAADRAETSRHPEIAERSGEFSITLPDGRWVGEVTEIEERRQVLRVLAVRTHLSADMVARSDGGSNRRTAA